MCVFCVFSCTLSAELSVVHQRSRLPAVGKTHLRVRYDLLHVSRDVKFCSSLGRVFSVDFLETVDACYSSLRPRLSARFVRPSRLLEHRRTHRLSPPIHGIRRRFLPPLQHSLSSSDSRSIYFAVLPISICGEIVATT